MKIFSLLVLALFLSFQAFAQDKKPKGKAHGHEMHAMNEDHEPAAMMYADKVTTRLGLNAEQKAQIKQAQMHRLEAQKELHREYMASAKAEMGENSDYEMERKKIQDDFKEEMREILNKDQYTKWESMHKREMKIQAKKRGIN